jgi:hypothetical protein
MLISLILEISKCDRDPVI